MTNRLKPGDTLVVASHNKGKLREFADLLAPFGLKVVSAGELGLPEPPETGTTFEENAAIKAIASTKGSGFPALSDDSGVCVDAIGGEPGVYSADWAGADKDFARAMRNVEEKMQLAGALTPDKRTGRFVSVLCLAWPDGEIRYYRGEIEGTMVWPPRGTQGFGYDPMFLPEGHERTFGEMEKEEKHGWSAGRKDALSHRARAFALFAEAELGA
ncbi:RdgB/HAM1 family non-canonical purine NTP pyrophosphatase [Kaistia dalseonensis]|uniref:dITP/XTP pyrophosphatase n=1 Tax=Kaistia dalseonensis TaxID=410840 RepID=A0ABU0H569_9HYPH|nr:RdgB/HAM1 family non-canonical purine NTP pyrophosphatase [Kaistia dalseonensis]MCX5494872.1 RdgB/HAM1 family non-canonical purine NTP pyrophosphatase [Kaistia dalseonensis]MDQ0437453.1 XTP/dITP diphosphohydrolase [Kaistia dalseonensis]